MIAYDLQSSTKLYFDYSLLLQWKYFLSDTMFLSVHTFTQ